jgi:hypothetical protein
MPLVYTDDTFKTAYDQATSDDLIAQAKAGEPILDTLNGEWFRISPEREAAARQQIAYVPPAPDALLKSTDWWGVSDRTMSAEETAYRQSLRDLPQTFANPEDVVWPTKP